ncbi:MAG TPA: hypothetical protein VE931_07555 [Pyrinomonadaceae bacterium]|nr:hypothetical protein [Pyrinomonadaceae bacterium]
MKTILAILIFALASTATAQKKLPQKPYTEWSLQEVMMLLQNSPWVEASVQFAQGRRGDVPDRPPGTEFYVEVRLYSALPIRQAIVRRMQLTIPYAKLTGAQRASFDAEVDGLLKCAQCAEYYIVTIASASQYPFSFATRGDPHTLDTVEVVKRVPQDELLRHVSLSNDNGELRNAARAVFTQRNEVVFLFSRVDEHGKPLITPANKKFSLEFDDYLSKKTEGSLKKFTFNVKDILRDTEVLF